MKKIIFLLLMCSQAFGMHYVIDRDGTVRDTGRGERGCVLGSSQVYLENGQKVRIDSLKGSDKLMSLGAESVIYQRVSGFEKNKVIRIETESGKNIVSTQNHPFYREGILYKASEFKKGDTIETIDGEEVIIKMRSYFTNEKVYNVILAHPDVDNLRAEPFAGLEAKDHKLILNGFVSGDLLIQKVLE